MAEFNAVLREKDNINIIDVKGFLDAHTAPDLENILTGLINESKFRVVVNFKELDYISSAGLGVFMAYIEQMRENNGDIKLAEMKTQVYNIFDLLGFPILYDILQTETEALNKFNQ
ncbi:MAG: STAS domain-containing protein [Ignavibacteriaceae bacterium]|nr:STAS domain-containing protein [Ignavibacteriaceae bacterium]NUM70828.1 STAS domain-containing protein [Ignavibacteriaceae bacterium]